MMNSKVKDALQIVATSAIVLGVALSPIIYMEVEKRYPDYKVGTCLKYSLNDDNEFEKVTYTYVYIEKVGKHRYKYIRFMQLDDGRWFSTDENDVFDYVDSYTHNIVVNCKELIPIIDSITKEEENE